MNRGSFGFGGQQRSYSFACFHADQIPNSLLAVVCPSVSCELVNFKNSPDSSGNVIIGSHRLSIVSSGVVLEPGSVSGWIPASNLNLIWHKEDDATTYLQYSLVGCPDGGPASTQIISYLLQESGHKLLQEDGGFILL